MKLLLVQRRAVVQAVMLHELVAVVGEQDDDGVVVTEMDNDSEAYRSGIREGDIIIRVGTNNVRNSNDFKDLIRTSSRKNTVLLLVKRNDVSRFYALEIDN